MSDKEVVSADVLAYQARVREELAGLTKQVEAPSSGKISVKGKVFTLADGRTSPGPMSVVILDFATNNSWYPGAYNANVKAAPQCWAIGKDLATLAPSAESPMAQAADCGSCQRNQWGSGQNGRGKACKNQRRLLLVAADFTDKSAPQTLYVSPTGIKQWDGYIRRLVTEYAARPMDVVTQVSFDPNQNYPTLQFEFVDRNPNIALAETLRQRYLEVLFKEPEAPAKAA